MNASLEQPVNFYEDELVRYEIVDDILYVNYKLSGRVDAATVSGLIASRASVQQGKAYSVVTELTGLPYVNKEARKLLLEHRFDGVRYLAFVSESFLQSFIFKLILRLVNWEHAPNVFSTREEAREWIKKMEAEEQ